MNRRSSAWPPTGVTVAATAERVVATVRDAGCGFDPAAATARAGGGQGLAGMRDRAESIGGEVRLESAPGAGTTLALTLPLGKGGIR